MAQVIEYYTGFDDVAIADIDLDGWGGSGGAIGAGRFGTGGSLSLTNTIRSRGLVGDTEYIFGFGWLAANAATTQDLMRIFEGATEHGRLAYNGNGTFSISRAGSITETCSLQSIVSSGWYHLEWYYKCHDTAGAWWLYLNGQPIIGPSTSLDTRNGGTGIMDTLSLRSNVAAAQRFDDLIISRGGSTRLGDGRSMLKLPTGDGGRTDFTPSTGVNHYAVVDDPSQNGDTDYVQTGVVGNKDTYTYPALGVTGQVLAVRPTWVARKTDASTKSLGPVLRRSGSDTDGTGQALGATYQEYSLIQELDPITGLAWTVADIDASEFGIKVTA